METYRIIRFYFNGGRRIIKRGLTLDEAQTHCSDLETSSSTCKKASNKRRTKIYGAWFDGYEKE